VSASPNPDPFEAWWWSLDDKNCPSPHWRQFAGVYVNKTTARAIWDAARRSETNWQERAEKAERHLQNLLARIHRDGGHYTGEHGIEKAAEDAEKIVVATMHQSAAMRAALEKLVLEGVQCADGKPPTHAWLNPETRALILGALAV
jgi:hypothetical protein